MGVDPKMSFNFSFTSQPVIRLLPAAHHGEVCDSFEQRRELPLPLFCL